MNPYINVYQNATHGAADGDIVSMDGENTSPISVLLDSAKEESKVVKLAIRTTDVYKTSENGATISFGGKTADKWLVAYDETHVGDEPPADTAFSSLAHIQKEITNTNVVFWVKALSMKNEGPIEDKDVKIRVTAKMIAI